MLALTSKQVVTVDGHVKIVILSCNANPLQEEVRQLEVHTEQNGGRQQLQQQVGALPILSHVAARGLDHQHGGMRGTLPQLPFMCM